MLVPVRYSIRNRRGQEGLNTSMTNECLSTTAEYKPSEMENLFELKLNISNDLIGDILMTPDDKKDYNEYHKILTISNGTQEFNDKIYEIFGYKIKDPKDYFKIHSTIDCIYRLLIFQSYEATILA